MQIYSYWSEGVRRVEGGGGGRTKKELRLYPLILTSFLSLVSLMNKSRREKRNEIAKSDGQHFQVFTIRVPSMGHQKLFIYVFGDIC